MINEKQAQKYCCEDIALIENYSAAVSDTERMWECHHRLEIDANGNTVFSKKDLINMGMYYDRPASELILIEQGEHRSLHSTGRHHTEEAKQKNRAAHIGKKCSDETKRKLRDANTGENNPNFGKHLSEERKKKISIANTGENHPMFGKKQSEEAKQKNRAAHIGKQKTKKQWLTPDGKIVEMAVNHAKRYHPDWKLVD